MKRILMAAALAAVGCGCISTHKNDGGSLNVLFNFISWGKTATHIADAAPFRFFDKLGEAKNGAYANACDQANCDSIVGAHYKVRIEDYFVFKKLTCEISGYPATLKGVELIENKTLPCCGCGKK